MNNKTVFPQLKYTFHLTKYHGTCKYSTGFCPALLYQMPPKSLSKYRNCRYKRPDSGKYSVTGTPSIFTKTCSLSLSLSLSLADCKEVPLRIS